MSDDRSVSTSDWQCRRKAHGRFTQQMW